MNNSQDRAAADALSFITGQDAQRDNEPCAVKALRDRLAELEAIVAKLPKAWRLNEAGELVQDVPVAPDDVLHRWLPGVWPEDEWQECVVKPLTHDSHAFGDDQEDFELWYSTRAAAKAARQSSIPALPAAGTVRAPDKDPAGPPPSEDTPPAVS